MSTMWAGYRRQRRAARSRCVRGGEEDRRVGRVRPHRQTAAHHQASSGPIDRSWAGTGSRSSARF